MFDFWTIIVFLIFFLTVFIGYGSLQFIVDWRYRMPPGPPSLPYLGGIRPWKIDPNVKPWKRLDLLVPIYGNVFTFYMGQLRFVVISTPSVIRHFIVNNAKSYSYRSDVIMPGFNVGAYPYGIISADGEPWTHIRRFSVKGLRDFGLGQMTMVLRVQEEASFLVQELEARGGQAAPGPLNQLISTAISNITCCTVFGKRFVYGDPKFLSLLAVTKVFFERPFDENALFFAMPILAKFSVPPQVKDLIDVDKVVMQMLRDSIEEHRHDFDPNNIRDFTDLFIQAEKSQEPIAFESYLGTMRDLVLAGTETTASAVTWTILYLCKWPEIQTRCQEAIDRVIATDRMPSLDDRPHLIYLDAVMCEILRHVTIVPNSLPHATANEVNTYEGYEIPPYTVILYNLWGVHHDENYWKDPEEFRPERWIDSNDGSLLSHSNYFMPFGVGPRICLGEQLARLEYFMFTVALLQRFTFSLPDNSTVSIEDGRHNITHVPPVFDVIVTKRHV